MISALGDHLTAALFMSHFKQVEGTTRVKYAVFINVIFLGGGLINRERPLHMRSMDIMWDRLNTVNTFLRQASKSLRRGLELWGGHGPNKNDVIGRQGGAALESLTAQ